MTPPETTRRGPAAMSDEHKAALARGRAEGRAVKDYLDAIAANKPKRGRKRTKESIGKRLDAIEMEIEAAAPIKALQLVQERMDLRAELEAMGDKVDLTELENAFVAVAAGYGERKGISYAAWREIGVDAAVLKRAGVKRSS
jgi:uncharacterized protein YicC (UPF0701 family)